MLYLYMYNFNILSKNSSGSLKALNPFFFSFLAYIVIVSGNPVLSNNAQESSSITGKALRANYISNNSPGIGMENSDINNNSKPIPLGISSSDNRTKDNKDRSQDNLLGLEIGLSEKKENPIQKNRTQIDTEKGQFFVPESRQIPILPPTFTQPKDNTTKLSDVSTLDNNTTVDSQPFLDRSNEHPVAVSNNNTTSAESEHSVRAFNENKLDNKEENVSEVNTPGRSNSNLEDHLSKNSLSVVNGPFIMPVPLINNEKNNDNAISGNLSGRYYVQYILGDGEDIDSVAARFRVTKKEFIRALANGNENSFGAGTRFVIPVRHYTEGFKDKSCDVIAKKYNISHLDLKVFNQNFVHYLSDDICLLPILDKKRRIIVEGSMNSGPGNYVPNQSIIVDESQPVNSLNSTKEGDNSFYTLPEPLPRPDFSSSITSDITQEVKEIVPVPKASPFNKMLSSLHKITPLPIRRKIVSKNITSTGNDSSSGVTSSILSPEGLNVTPQKIERIDNTNFIMPIESSSISPASIQDSGNTKFDGINIFPSSDLSVKAAADGIVAYVGSDISAFSIMVIIRHANKMVTIYGHNSKVMVKRGQKVKQGEIIGQIGHTSNVTNPRLYFAMRDSKRIVDPMLYISK